MAANRFEEYMQKLVEPAIDEVFAEPIVITPRRSTPNGRGMQDPTRQVVTVQGVFTNPSKQLGIQLGVRKSYREANDLRALSMAREPYISVDRKHFTGLIGEPRQGDRIRLPNRPDHPEYEVMTVERDGITRLRMKLIQRGPQA